jgi:hypothetical protein
MNRNEGRFGVPGMPEETLELDEGTAAPAVAATASPTQAESPFSWSTPTEFVELPSGGMFYGEGHPLHGKSSVEIRYMTAKDEDILTSQALIKQGIAIDRLLQNVIVDPKVKVEQLLIGDKNALIIAARITGYGADYETRATCPSCGNLEKHTFDLEQQDKEYDNAPALAEYGARFTEANTFILTLPTSAAEVEVKLLTGADELEISKETERKRRRNLGEALLTDQMRKYIVSVNGNNSPIVIVQYIHAMPARDSRVLRKFYDAVNPTISLEQFFACGQCAYTGDMEVPLTADFFWPK